MEHDPITRLLKYSRYWVVAAVLITVIITMVEVYRRL